jgi:hypothetical protein
VKSWNGRVVCCWKCLDLGSRGSLDGSLVGFANWIYPTKLELSAYIQLCAVGFLSRICICLCQLLYVKIQLVKIDYTWHRATGHVSKLAYGHEYEQI